MHLAEFILHDMQGIVAEWETFAATLLPAASGMTSLALRDHAQPILEAIAKDIGSDQTRLQQSEKSKGRAPIIPGAPETAAQTHAVLRAQGGFDIKQLVAEYRALRASVVRRWMDAHPTEPPDVDDLIRFNEAIDQAIAESVGHFDAQVERARNLLLGMLGHDMQSPLTAIVLTAKYLAALNASDQVSTAAQRLIRSGRAMQGLLDDLVDYNRTRLGLGLRVASSPGDLTTVVSEELDRLRAVYPNRRIELQTGGDTRGRLDSLRVQQVLRNLVSNAMRYGEAGTPVHVKVSGDAASVCVEVTNTGPAIDPAICGQLFDPLRRGPVQGTGDEVENGLGLGLFIVHEITLAHGGEIDVRSEAGLTTFAVRLPRDIAHAVPAGRTSGGEHEATAS